MGMRILGLQRAINRFEKFEEGLDRATQGSVNDSIRDLYKESQNQVPKDTTALQKSGRIIHIRISGHRRTSSVKYGLSEVEGGPVDYAAAVHEILKASHAAPTKAKYVEDPLVQGVRNYKRYTITNVEREKRKAFR